MENWIEKSKNEKKKIKNNNPLKQACKQAHRDFT